MFFSQMGMTWLVTESERDNLSEMGNESNNRETGLAVWREEDTGRGIVDEVYPVSCKLRWLLYG